MNCLLSNSISALAKCYRHDLNEKKVFITNDYHCQRKNIGTLVVISLKRSSYCSTV